MNSLKNIVVIVLLLGVSYGAYQVINAPDPTLGENGTDPEGPSIEIGMESGGFDGLAFQESAPSSMDGQSDDSPAFPIAPPNAAAPPLIDPVPEGATFVAPTADASATATKESGLPETFQPPMMTDDPSSPAGGDRMAFNTGGPPAESATPAWSNTAPAVPPMSESAGVSQGTPGESASRFEGLQDIKTPSTPDPSPAAPWNQPGVDVASGATPSGGGFNPSPQQMMVPVERPGDSSTAAIGPLADVAGTQAPMAPSSSATLQPVTPATPDPNSTYPNGSAAASIANGSSLDMPSASETSESANADTQLLQPLKPQPAAPASPTPVAVDWSGIDMMVKSRQYREALVILTNAYRASGDPEQRNQMLQWLDILAGKVVYSAEHWLQSHPYVVAPGETLQTIADKWKVPPELIYRVNRAKIADPGALVAGTELKQIQGPFHAEISLGNRELTMYLGDLYAGRFPVDFGSDAKFEGQSFRVSEKSEKGQEYRDVMGQCFPSGDVNNPYGDYWIGLGDHLCIHDSAEGKPSDDRRGCIRLSRRDASDVYGILSSDSSVRIIR